METAECPFCNLPAEEVIWEADLVVAFRDRFPVSEGHTLVISRAHHETYFNANPWEQAEIWRAVNDVKLSLDREFLPSGYNVGFNVKESAGQTVMHLHVHVIPRYEGDVPDPRGGVRGVIPSKQLYKAEPPSSAASIIEDRGSAFRADPFAGLSGFVAGEEAHFAPVLAEAFQAAESIDIVAAFVQPSGLNLIREDLRQALEKGASVRFLTGDYMNATNHHALRALLSLKSEFPDQFASYFFVRGREGVAFVGSSNLTAIALTNGIEWNLRTSATANKDEFNDIRDRYEALLASPQVKPLTRALIDEYSQRAPVPSKPEPKIPAPPPHSVQTEALYALQEARKDGARAGLVVMATGLGKTYLSALDFKALDGKRALFIAHREETLTQARDSWERLFPEKVTGLLIGLAPASTTTH